MRNLKTITTQDHMIHVVETTSDNNDDLVCSDEMKLDDVMTIFYAGGALNHFTKENLSDDWNLSGTTNAPTWAFSKPNVLVGGATVTPTILIIFIAKAKISSTPKPEYLSSLDVEELDREKFIELGAHNFTQTANSTTYETIGEDEILDDDVIIE